MLKHIITDYTTVGAETGVLMVTVSFGLVIWNNC
jgi:hypothetical protein